MNAPDELCEEARTAILAGDPLRAQALCLAILEQDNGHFGACYLLACEEAHAGNIAAARLYFQRAMVREPVHLMCRFQAGLLELTAGDLAAGAHIWAWLETNLPDDHYVKLFVQGCLALSMDRFDEAKQLLQAGIANNQENPALNRDMQMLLALPVEAGTAPAAPVAEPQPQPQAGSTLAALHLFHPGKTRH